MDESGYKALENIRAFLHFLENGSEQQRDAVYQWIANEANDSEYAVELEPKQAICLAFHYADKRRAFDTRELEEGDEP